MLDPLHMSTGQCVTDGCPFTLAITVVVQTEQLAAPTHHVSQVLHALPGGEGLVTGRRERTHHVDQGGQRADIPRAQCAVALPGQRGEDVGNLRGGDAVAGNAQETRRVVIERGIGGECGYVVLGSEVQQLI